MKKSSKQSLTRFRDVVNKAKFNPNKAGQLKLLVDVDNPDYYEEQAILIIREAQRIRRNPGIPTQDYTNHMVDAIRLLLLAEGSVNGSVHSVKEKDA